MYMDVSVWGRSSAREIWAVALIKVGHFVSRVCDERQNSTKLLCTGRGVMMGSVRLH